MRNLTAHQIRLARDAAESKILEAVREFEHFTECEVRKVEIIRSFIVDGSGPPQQRPAATMLDVDLGRPEVVK